MDYNRELCRKSFHLTALIFPALYHYTSREVLLCILIPMAAAGFIVDFVRMRYEYINSLFIKLTGLILREHEHKSINGTTYLVSSFAIIVFFFPKLIVLASMLFLIFGDMFAALIGRRFGRIRLGKKSLEGSLAFLVCSVIIVLILMPEFFWIGLIGGVVGMTAEFYAGVLDDNFVIPLFSALSMYLAALVMNVAI